MQGINASLTEYYVSCKKCMEFSKSQQPQKQSNQPNIILSTWTPATYENNFPFPV